MGDFIREFEKKLSELLVALVDGRFECPTKVLK
jgi:hypothetical protein